MFRIPPLYPRETDPVPTVQEAGRAPGSVWTGAENPATTEIRSPDRPARSKSLYRLRHPGPPTDLGVHELYEMWTVLFCLGISVAGSLRTHATQMVSKTTSLIENCGDCRRLHSHLALPGKCNLGHNNTPFLISRIHFDLFLILPKCACLCLAISMLSCKCPADSQTVKHFLRCSSIETRVINTDIKICYSFQRN